MKILEIFNPTKAEKKWLAKECYRRSAEMFEKSGMYRDAAESWKDAGEIDRAADMLLGMNDYTGAAPLLLDAGRYNEALDCYRRWISLLSETDVLSHVRSYLGVSACLKMLEDDDEKASHAYFHARKIIEDETDRQALLSGRCWEALSKYGEINGRYDLIPDNSR